MKHRLTVPGARLRSRLNWRILKTLAMDIGAPLAAAQVVGLVRFLSSRSLSQAVYRYDHPSALTVYLHRLADQGYVRLSGLRRQRQATLTPSGRRALVALETYLRERDPAGIRSETEAMASRAQESRRRATGRRRPLYAGTARRLAALQKAVPGLPRARAFVSYDLPRQAKAQRHRIIALLRRSGYERMHHSFYVGPAIRLREVLEAVEPDDLLPRLQWGTLTVFSH